MFFYFVIRVELETSFAIESMEREKITGTTIQTIM